MDASARLAFNMKVLKRHDPAIEDIIDSVSYVVLYSLDDEWVRTAAEENLSNESDTKIVVIDK